jgi:hypothetical protein
LKDQKTADSHFSTRNKLVPSESFMGTVDPKGVSCRLHPPGILIATSPWSGSGSGSGPGSRSGPGPGTRPGRRAGLGAAPSAPITSGTVSVAKHHPAIFGISGWNTAQGRLGPAVRVRVRASYTKKRMCLLKIISMLKNNFLR